jgi:hypothetical protein
MDNNARPHRALLVNEFLESKNICQMDWPPRSPDFNPIQHVSDALGRAIALRNPPPRTIQELKTALVNEWDQLPQALINCLISSMTSCCKACIAVREDHRGDHSCKRGPYFPISFVYSATAVSDLQTSISVTHKHMCLL